MYVGPRAKIEKIDKWEIVRDLSIRRQLLMSMLMTQDLGPPSDGGMHHVLYCVL